MKILIVGAGFAGACLARKLADAGNSITVIDKRHHVGGNAFDEINSQNERIHIYGPHLFHGDSDSVAVKWFSQFTDWVKYEHRVLAQLPQGSFTPLPVNRKTLEDVFKIKFRTEHDVIEFITSLQKPVQEVQSADDVFVSSVGEKLTNIFFRPYTLKMWNIDATKIEAGVGKRLPTRTTYDDRYFTDNFQYLPSDGYTKAFDRIFQHNNIRLDLSVNFDHDMLVKYDHAFIAMPIDKFFDFRYGKLPYRSIRFENCTTKVAQPSATVNFTDNSQYTRSTQWDLLPNSNRSRSGWSTTTLEIPCSPEDNNDEYFYPLLNAQSRLLYQKYADLATTIKYVTFCGRAGLFRYLDMVPAINIHLNMAEKFIAKS
jgi:UDP-galactopyranose mutase